MADLPALNLVRGSGGRRSSRFSGVGNDARPLDLAFLRYLSSRVDLLPAVDCIELAAVPARTPPSPWGAVAESLSRELGGSPRRVYEYLDPEPLDAGPLEQRHAARLVGGRPVILILVRPEVQAEVPIRPGALAPVVETLAGAGLAREALDRAERDFHRYVEEALDLAAWLEALQRLSLSGAAPGRLKVPRAHPECSGRYLLTRDRVGGATLEELVADCAPADRSSPEDPEAAVRHRSRSVRRLCRLWLEQAVVEGLFPVDPVGRDVRFLEDGRIAFGGRLARMPPESQADLTEYLSAVASGDLERAAYDFERLLAGDPGEARDALRLKVRHAEPFRDPAWDFGGERFVKLVLVHWQAASALGLGPRPPVEQLFRGLFLLTRRIHRLDPEDQPVLQGLLKVRFALTWRELRGLAGGDALAEITARQAAALLTLPQKLDRALSLASDGRAGARRPGNRRDAGGPRDDRLAFSALLVALVAVVVATHQLGTVDAPPVWLEKLGAGVALIVGSLALFAGGRRH